MYIVIEKDKSNALKHKARKLKELACDMMDCLEEAYSESRESESRTRARRDGRLEGRRYNEDYDDYNNDDDDYSRDDRGRGMRPRY